MLQGVGTRQLPLLPEAELLVWCARTDITDELKQRIRKRVQESINWSMVLDMAEYHGVVPLLYKSLSTVMPDLVPAHVLATLRQKAQVGSLLNQSLAKDLVDLCEAFEVRGVPVIPIKGATLAVLAYGDLALRDFTDLDLLIPKQALSEARTIILSQGYERKTTNGESRESHTHEGPYHVFVKKRPLSRVDLQWVMAHQHFAFWLDRPEFWRSRRPVMLKDKPVPGLSSEMLLIVLCVHGSKHAWELLKWVCDVAELLRSQPNLDWDQIVSCASNWRCQRMLYMGLSLAHRLLDAPLPEGVLTNLKHETEVQALSHRMPASLLKNYHEGISEEQAGALYFALKDSWHERWWLGVLLCRAHSQLALTPPAWFRWRTSLSRMARLIVPAHRALTRLLSPTIRHAIHRWVTHGI
ncbi:nucleotidyltransferase family protein [Nitrospira sp. BLG_1]|uniref:nucleotidyltransferase domain-containing protein n=1 Tax=Nitrospira sp. BLG_1 TaxID=3395883 RepID=UPI0039BD9134